MSNFSCDEFKLNQPPVMPNLPPALLCDSDDDFSYAEWMTALRRDDGLVKSCKLWEWSPDLMLLGFGSGARKLFRSIADEIRSYHSAKYFCGDLWNSVRIFVSPQGYINVQFTRDPVKADGQYTVGVDHDMVHFRFLVASLIKATNITYDQLPAEFYYFFSKVFTSYIRDKTEACFLQLYHPVFFDGKDRINFMMAVIDFRKCNCTMFDTGLDLGSRYALDMWHSRIPNHSTFRKILDYKSDDYEFSFTKPKVELGEDEMQMYFATIPKYIRNVHSHYIKYEPMKLRRNFEKELNGIFPGLCSKILDCIILEFEYNPYFRYKFYAQLADRSRGFDPESYSL